MRALAVTSALLLASTAAGCAATATTDRPRNPPSVAVATAPTEPIRLRWTVRKLDQTYGFLVYRSDAAGGPFQRVNDEIVHVSAPATVENGESVFRFVDTRVVPGRKYFYYIDAISSAGIKSRLSGVLERTAGAGVPGEKSAVE